MIPVQPIHSFPARMAPEIALKELQQLPSEMVVLDPMMGSGTVLRVALDRGLRAIGRDIDPLAVLMGRVWTTPLDTKRLCTLAAQLVQEASNISAEHISLPWIDDDAETSAFVDFWFGESQKADLRKLSTLLKPLIGPEGNALRLALSRIIITKNVGASLARDVSHSRPHRVKRENTFIILDGFLRSVTQLAKRLDATPTSSKADVRQEDARHLDSIESGSIDAVITSPPYLNAIDYMRGHRLALVWFGYRLSELRILRRDSIGIERAPDICAAMQEVDEVVSRLALELKLQPRELSIIRRYVFDLTALLSEIRRVVRPGGKIVFVIGNSCIRGVFVKNALAIKLLAERNGLHFQGEEERDIPPSRRYLPPPDASEQNDLNKRMRTETVLKFIAV